MSDEGTELDAAENAGTTEGTPKDEAPKADEAPKDEAPKDEAPKDEAPKDEAPKDEAPKDEAPKDDDPKDDDPKDEAPKDEAPKDEEAPKADEAPKDEEPAVVAEPPPPPEPLHVDAIEPATATAAEGTAVVVRVSGAASLEGARLFVGGQTIEAQAGDGTLAATLPALPAGFADVKVTLPDGREGVLVHGLTVVGPPSLERAEPFVASTRGGSTIVLHGRELRVGGVVLFGAEELSPTAIDGASATFTTPPAALGSVTIGFRNPDGQASRTLSLDVREGPVVESVEPRALPLSGGPLTLRGRGFLPGLTVTIGPVATPVTAVGDAEVTLVAPSFQATAQHAIRITNPDGLSFVLSDALAFEHRPPRITSVSPAKGWVIGGTRVTLEGEHLGAARAVTFEGRPAELQQVEDGRVVVLAPPGDEPPGPATVRIVRADGEAFELAAGFTYEPVPAPPKILSIEPAKGFTTGGQTLKIQGDNFDASTRIRIGGEPCVAKLLARTLLEVVTPARAEAGAVDVDAISGDVVVTVAAAFTYEARPKPVITGVTPAKGPVMGGTRVTVEGENLFPEYWIRVGRERPTQIPSRSATQIVLLTPPRPQVGLVDVEIGVGETVLATRKAAFQYEGIPAPTLDSVSPNRGGTGGGTEVTIEGKNFVKETQVLFGGKPATKIKFVDAKTLEVKTPPGENGKMVDVTVKNPDGKEATSKRAFQYDSRY